MSLISIMFIAGGCSCLLMFPSVQTSTLSSSTRTQNPDQDIVQHESLDITHPTSQKNILPDNQQTRHPDVRIKTIKSRGQIFNSDFSDKLRWTKEALSGSKHNSLLFAKLPNTRVNLLDIISEGSLSPSFNQKKFELNVNLLNVLNISKVAMGKQDLELPATRFIPVETGNIEKMSSYTSLDTADMKLRRKKRSAHQSHHSSGSTHSSGGAHGSTMIDTCEKVSGFVYLTEAEDVYGNTVQVMDYIDVGVRQVFYETYCRRNSSAAGGAGHGTGTGGTGHGSCTGVDSTLYDSVCLDGNSYVYGKVSAVDSRGAVVVGGSWRLIKIRTSCNCGLIRKHRGGGGVGRNGRRSK